MSYLIDPESKTNTERNTNTWKTKHTALTAAILGGVVPLVLIAILVTICYRRHKRFKPPKVSDVMYKV